MYNLNIIQENNVYYIQARSDARADLLEVSMDCLHSMSKSLKSILRDGENSSGPGYKLIRDAKNCYILYIGTWEDSHFHGYCMNKSKLTALYNQLASMLNG